ncbi:hypothetical protein BWD42_12935 [Sphingobacterium sp. CZ-UAM]|nr:hypothetical protein BWD42_12935 [Sphingobacterium sp. CZ-UAM]
MILNINTTEAQEGRLSNGIFKVGNVNYSVRIMGSQESDSNIFISSEGNSEKILKIEKDHKEARESIPRWFLTINNDEILKVKRSILGDSARIQITFYFDKNAKLFDLRYMFAKADNITVEQFKELDQQVRKTARGSISIPRSFNKDYYPYVMRSFNFK